MRAVRNVVLVRLARLVDDRDHATALVITELDRARHFGDHRLALRLARFEHFFDARQTRDDVFRCHAAGVERTQRELGTGFTDRLRSNDADRRADVGPVTGRKIATVAHRADAVLRLTREHRADFHRRDARIDDSLRLLFIDLVVALDHDVLAFLDVLGSAAADDAIRKGLDDFLARADVAHRNAVAGRAIIFADDHVLSDVDETACEVARVGGTERRIRKTLTRAVRRDEVLEDGKAFFERRLDRDLEDSPRRVGHESAHTAELLHLGDRATSTGRRHHEDRIERILRRLHGAGDGVAGLRPDLDRLVVAFVVADEALIEQTVQFVDFALRFVEDVVLRLRHDDVADRHGRTRERCKVEAELLDRIEEARGLSVTVTAIAVGNRLFEGALVDDAVDVLFVPLHRESRIEDRATNGRADQLALPAHVDPLVQRNV